MDIKSFDETEWGVSKERKKTNKFGDAGVRTKMEKKACFTAYESTTPWP